MSVNEAFSAFQKAVNADPEQVKEARTRRDVFKGAFLTEVDVDEVVPSGSLARGTHKQPIHDVDVILVFDQEQHPEWGQPGASAEAALDHTRGRVNALLGATNGTHGKVVRLARWRNHAVKCFLDDPGDPNAFTVDAMPALRRNGMLLIPEAMSKQWVSCDPEYLISAVARKHAEWPKFAGTVRMLKWWAAEQNTKIKPLVMEILALNLLPTGRSQPSAIKDFFVKASHHIEGHSEVVDPAEICGPIQDDLDYEAFEERLKIARHASGQAIVAQGNNDVSGAVRWWGEVFGDAFPASKAQPGLPAAVPPPGPRPVKDSPQG